MLIARLFPPWGDKPPSVKLSDDVFVLFRLSVVFPGVSFMVKLERAADAKVPTKVTNADINAMVTPMAINILLFMYSIIVNGIYVID